MPELPEVETVRQVLRKRILNQVICDIDIRYEKMIKTDLADFKSKLIGQKIIEIDRIGKHLLIHCESDLIISHLRMEGKYFYRHHTVNQDKHDHVVFCFQDGMELRYNDVRKFGTMHLKDKNSLFIGEPLEKLGLEPFSPKFTLSYLKSKIKGIRPIKAVLLDQHVIAGLGNIYVDEVLYHAKLHPSTLACNVSDKSLEVIRTASISVLEKAISLGGTTIRSYYSDDEVSGRFQNELLVHGRKDGACFTCGEIIEKIRVGGRGTYYCPHCQK